MKIFNTAKLLITLISALLLGACSMFGKDDVEVPEYYEESESQPLDIPDNLDRPSSDTALTIDHEQIPLSQSPVITVPPRVVVNQSGSTDNSIMRWETEGVYILVDEAMDGLKNRLESVILESGMELLGEADDGDYRFVYEHTRPEIETSFWKKISFWREDPPDFSGSYLTLSRPEGGQTRVYLKYADGGEVPIEAAEHVLAILRANMG